MSDSPAKYLWRARDLLARGNRMAQAGLPDDAGRTAYLAAFQAAQAVIQARTGRVAKTHRGVRVAFARIVQAEPSLAPSLLTFRARSYELKSMADYSAEPDAGLTPAAAADALAEAGRFVAAIAALLDSPAPDGA